jgi:hypothetical protein
MADTATEQALLRRRMTTMGAVFGGAITFIAVGIVDELIKIALGAAIGAGIGLFFWAQVARAKKERRAVDLESLSKNDLMTMAENAGVEGRSSMTKAQLVEAIAARTSVPDDTGARVIDLVEGTEEKLNEMATKVVHKVRRDETGSTPTTNGNGTRSRK